jgi:lipopolysaccharide export system protein LptC
VSRKTFLINFFFFSAMTISLIAINQWMRGTSSYPTIDNDRTPDAYLINASYLRTNEQGQQEIALFSPIVKHYHYQDSSTFQNPRIELYKNGQRWLITSHQATGLKGTEIFYLKDNVIVKQLPTKRKAGTILWTQALTVFPKKEWVTTKDFVTIEQPGLKISGIGLVGSLKDSNIQLLSKTRGQYDPKQSH